MSVDLAKEQAEKKDELVKLGTGCKPTLRPALHSRLVQDPEVRLPGSQPVGLPLIKSSSRWSVLTPRRRMREGKERRTQQPPQTSVQALPPASLHFLSSGHSNLLPALAHQAEFGELLPVERAFDLEEFRKGLRERFALQIDRG